MCTETAVSASPFIFPLSCEVLGAGAPISCGDRFSPGSTIPDCCSAFCSADPQPLPARCN
jgi:hypothetical protein